jgi:hypothetical protein
VSHFLPPHCSKPATDCIKWCTPALLTGGTNPMHADMCHRVILLAHNVLQMVTEWWNKKERSTGKQVPETLLCNLLGLSRLSWDEQDLLSFIWQQLYQQPNKGSKEVALRTFFQELGMQCPAFSHFHNSLLFHLIVAHKFEPGAAYETCHHGRSLAPCHKSAQLCRSGAGKAG